MARRAGFLGRRSRLWPGKKPALARKAGSFGQGRSRLWPEEPASGQERSRLWPEEAGFWPKEAGFWLEEAGFWPEAGFLQAKSRLTPAYAGSVILETVKSRLTPAYAGFLWPKPASSGQSRLFWPKAGYTGPTGLFWPEAGFFWPGRSRLLARRAGFGLERAGFRRLWPASFRGAQRKKPAYTGESRLLLARKAGSFGQKPASFRPERSRLWPKVWAPRP